MKINPIVKEVLKSHKISLDAGLLVLLGIYFRLDVDSVVPKEVVHSINLTKIVERDYNLNTINWNVPLFEGMGNEGSWEWVVEWVKPFGKMNPDRMGSWRDAITRMQEFFRLYPQFRKDDVIKARDLYLSRLRDPQFVMKSHKFIFDGTGALKKSTLLQYCDEVTQKSNSDTTDIRGKVH